MADPAGQAGPTRRFAALAALALVAALLVGALALLPHYPSGSLPAPVAATEPAPPVAAARDSGADATALAQRLSAHVEKQPRDARAWAILARLQFEMDHFAEAAQAYERALTLPTKVANDPALWCEYADALALLQDGRLAGRPRELVARALALNPNHPKALEMAGGAEYEQGEYAAALRYWRALLAAQDPGSRAHAELSAAIARAERLAGISIPVLRQ